MIVKPAGRNLALHPDVEGKQIMSEKALKKVEASLSEGAHKLSPG